MASTTTSTLASLASNYLSCFIVYRHLCLAIEQSLRQLPKSDFSELKSYAKPPLACLAILEGVGILLEPSKQIWEWTDDKKLIGGNSDQFLQRLFDLDKDSISLEQLKRLDSILGRTDCQPGELANVSSLCHQLGLWLRAIVAHTTQRQQTH